MIAETILAVRNEKNYLQRQSKIKSSIQLEDLLLVSVSILLFRFSQKNHRFYKLNKITKRVVSESPRIPPPICGACAYPQRLNPDCVIPETRCAHPSVRKQAHEECLMLKQAPFSPCHDVINPDPFYHACIQDRCKAFGAKPVCEILEAYSLECHRANVRLRWRMRSNCFKTCPKPFVWSDCGKPCDASCGDLDPQCEGECVPGCRCPAGLVKHAGGCTKPQHCQNYRPPPVEFDDDTACI
ncbi:unnamed protein product [Oikopleura dioica]|uniref:VWF/SSPO/Zonadhesin-like cysteine-rich domain-containing protein n=1 Tax=Oikopleura dioica TaxID=34765 RepID=E4YH61_OIKDI|nr:unnamed protein product [Oikopleura dioica]